MNTPIQGSAADIIKLAMLKLHSLLEEGKSGSQMILQVHDELIFTVPDTQVTQMGRVVAEVMSGVYPLVVPLKVDLQSGLNWYEMKPLVI